MKRIGYLTLLMCLHCGSGLEPLGFDALVDKQPKVLSVTPVDGANGYDGSTVEVLFSRPIDSKTVSSKSFLVVPVAEGSVDVQALWKQAQDNKLTPNEGNYEVSPDGLTVRFHSSKSFPPKVRCGVLVTPKLFSQDQLPFNQTPGAGPNPFFSSFYAEGIASESETVVDDKSSSSTSSSVPPPALPKSIYLKLSEIFYDANGVDTNGDLFIELTGEPEHDISGYQINMVRGSDGKIMDTIKIPVGMETNGEGLFVIADAITGQPGMTKVVPVDFVTSLDPPNGPDCIQLVDPSGKLADAVGYGSPLVLRGENNLLCYEGLPAPDAPSGKSLTRRPETFDTDNNAEDWIINNTPTPGSVEVN